ncbi:MAG TPA: hypothetical protein VEH06_01385 [Candidatus Bathyarchaeia archaeon]|nr:hypothetical protein [Candidatus Bathyarchaeia archaeon]
MKSTGIQHRNGDGLLRRIATVEEQRHRKRVSKPTKTFISVNLGMRLEGDVRDWYGQSDWFLEFI